jgi:hypothetical protein
VEGKGTQTEIVTVRGTRIGIGETEVRVGTGIAIGKEVEVEEAGESPEGTEGLF